MPTLVLWGARDPVFTDRYLRDLLHRLPHAQVHRNETASHLVTEDSGSCAATASDVCAGPAISSVDGDVVAAAAGVVDSVWYCMARVRAPLPRH